MRSSCPRCSRDGQLFPAAALALVLPIFLPITVAVVAGDTIAGEAATGTLRYLLVRPVGRLRLLAAKLAAVAVFVLLAVVFVTVTAYIVGVLAFGVGPDASLGGTGGITSLSGVVLTPTQLAERTALTIAYLALCMLALGAVGLFFSTLTDSPLAAALGVLAFVVASTVLLPLDAAAAIRFYLPTRALAGLGRPLPRPDPLAAVRQGATVQAGYVLVAFGAAWANFATKDVTSYRAPPPGQRGRRRGRADTSATAEGSPGSCPCDTGPLPQASWRATSTAPSRRAESGGVTVWSAVVQIDSHGRRRPTPAVASSRTSALPGASCLQADRAGVGGERDGAARQRGAAQRRSERDDPARLGRPVVAGDPQPGHHPARRIADDVHARRARGQRAVDGPVERVDLGGEVAGAVAGQRHHGGGAAGRADAARQRLQRGPRAAVAGDEQHRAEHVLRGPGVGRDGGPPRRDQPPDHHHRGHEHGRGHEDQQQPPSRAHGRLTGRPEPGRAGRAPPRRRAADPAA